MPADGPRSDWGEASFWQWQGLQSHWRVHGPSNGTPLVLLHGFGASSDHWRHNAAPLAAAGYQVYGLDLIGFGRSAQPGHQRGRPIDNRLWGRQVVAFLEQVVQASTGRPAVLVGNSLGGLTALTAAVLQPDLVAAVAAAPLPDPALLQPIPPRRARLWRRLRRPAVVVALRLLPLGMLVPLISRTSLIRLALQGAYHRPIHHDSDLHQLIAAPARRPSAARALRAMSIGMALRPRGATAPALLERLAALPHTIPLLLLWGRQDRLVPPMIGKKLQQQHAWLELQVINGSGHCPHDETPEVFHQTLLNWLDRNLEAHVRC
ncbi:MAG: alpha/beta fold hydrolase [Synechococcus sp.]